MHMKINVELVKKLRKEKAWSQEELALACDVSLRTIQRIENQGNASLESKKAIASAFDIKVSDLDFKENTSAVSDEETESFYFRIEDGTKLSEIIGGAYAYRLNHDNPNNEEETELLSWAAQTVQDYGDLWQELDAGERIKASFDLSQLVKDLEDSGFWLFGLRSDEPYPGVKGDKWPIANVFIMRSDNPKIIKLDLTCKS